jgi:hypothetical protein
VAECLAAFVQDLTALLNRYSMENDSNTPDFILAEYLLKCLETWNATVTHREQWCGRVPRLVASVPDPGGVVVDPPPLP